MNSQKGKIEYCHFTWNPVTGCNGPLGTGDNPQRCWYCWANGFATRLKKPFHPQFHEDRLDELDEAKRPSRIAVGLFGDMWHPDVPDEWICDALEATLNHREHTYQFLTRHPANYGGWAFPPRTLLGATIDGTEPPKRQVRIIENLLEADAGAVKRWISFEPLIGTIDPAVLELVPALDWVVIGALTGPRYGRARLDVQSFLDIVKICKVMKIPRFEKDNLQLSAATGYTREHAKFK